MASLQDIYAYIKPYASGLPDVSIDVEAVALAKELASNTLALRDHVYMDAQQSWGMYQIELPSDRQLEVITKVCVNGMEKYALPSKPCDGCVADGYWIDRGKTLSIYPGAYQDEEDGIEVEYAYSPKMASCEIDEDFLEKYGFAISKGVLGRVLMMKDKKWNNPQLAARYEQEWRMAKASALIDGQTPFTRAAFTIGSDDWIDT